MIKELEALIALRSGDTYRIPGSVVLSSEQYKAIAKALTPPTSDEVCEAIEEDTKLDVIYIPESSESSESSEFEFRFKSTFSLICKVFGEKICIYYMLAPRTLSLIGRFYESEAGK